MKNEPTHEMPLGHALRVLCDCHTKDDSIVTFCVEHMPCIEFSGHSPEDYIAAWSVVRRAAGFTSLQKG